MSVQVRFYRKKKSPVTVHSHKYNNTCTNPMLWIRHNNYGQYKNVQCMYLETWLVNLGMDHIHGKILMSTQPPRCQG